MNAKRQLSQLYTDICYTLTDYENDNDPETTEKDWIEIFYSLLVRTQNEIDCLVEE